MKVAVLFDLSSAASGGGFTFNKLIYDEIVELSSKSQIEFVKVHSRANSLNAVPDIAIPGKWHHKLHVFQSIIRQLFSTRVFRHGVSLRVAQASSLNSVLLNNGVEFVWAVQPLSTPINIPYMTTSWDISHRITPYFPEISGFGEIFAERDKVARHVFERAFRIVVGTDRGAREIECAYGINRERILVQPFPVKRNPKASQKLRQRNRFIYPANFWPHKTHLVLIDALALAQNHITEKIELFLTGSDRGSLDRVKRRVRELSLDENVTFTGHVDEATLSSLYITSNALVFPSLVGPDNLPPLEAMSHGARVIVGDIPGAREQLREFATFFDPLDSSQLAKQLIAHIRDFSESAVNDPTLDLFVDSLAPKEYVRSILREIHRNAPLIEGMNP